MKRKIFTVISYILIVVALLQSGYLLSPELQEKIPYLNEATTWIIGITTGLGGLGGLTILEALARSEKRQTDSNTALIESHFKDKEEVKENTESIKKLDKEQKATNQKLDKLLRYMEVEFESKLTNPMITEHVEKLIRGVLNEEPEEK